MKGKLLAAVFVFLCLAMGCATLEESPKGAVKATPVITQSFAAGEIRVGETWKIYLNASDPDGEMINIYGIVDQPGQTYPLSITRISKENGKESHNTSGRAGGLKSPGTAQSGWKNFHARIVLPLDA